MRWRFLALLPVLALLAAPVRADTMSDAKNFFKAGAAAYTAGDYLAAIQALDAAYGLTPLPGIAFSLAQAERRQYFVSREPAHLMRAIELYRVYLQQVTSGGRRADATDALAQLEPLAAAVPAPSTTDVARPPVQEVQKTRLMVSSEAPHAAISLDGAAGVPSPLIAEVTAGEHAVRVSAAGFFPAERRVVAIAGGLVPVEVELKEQPAVVLVEPSSEAALYVDGSYLGMVRKGTRIELTAGTHQFAFAKKGRRLESMIFTLERGSTRRLPVDLRWTGQRMTAVSLFVVSGTTLLAGLGLATAAAEREYEAEQILKAQNTRALDEAELHDYDEKIQERNRFRASAIGTLSVSAASLVAGFLLFEYDEPNVHEDLPHVDRSKPSVKLEGAIVPSLHGIDVRGGFRF